MPLSEQDFLALVQAARPVLHVHAHQILGDRASQDDVEDIVEVVIQEAWRRVFLPTPSEPPIEELTRGYLWLAIYHRCMDFIRDAPPEIPLSDLADPDEDTAPDWDHLPVDPNAPRVPYVRPDWSVKLDVRAAVDRIPIWAADLLIRRHVDGQTLEEIARETGIPLGGGLVRRLAMAEALLRAELRDYGPRASRGRTGG